MLVFLGIRFGCVTKYKINVKGSEKFTCNYGNRQENIKWNYY